jgi:hypothetical protein
MRPRRLLGTSVVVMVLRLERLQSRFGRLQRGMA